MRIIKNIFDLFSEAIALDERFILASHKGVGGYLKSATENSGVGREKFKARKWAVIQLPVRAYLETV